MTTTDSFPRTASALLPTPLVLDPRRLPPSPWPLILLREDVMLWRSRGTTDLWAGIGCAFSNADFDECRRQAASLARESLPFAPRCFGCVAFEPTPPVGELWRGFPAERYWIPNYLLRWRGGEVEGLRLGDADGIDFRLPETAEQRATCIDETENFALTEWTDAVERIRREIQESRLQKAVLSRQVRLTADQPFSVPAVLARLADAADDSYFLACRHADSDIFASVSPERLFRLEGTQLQIDSLAGTRPRGDDARSNFQLKEQLSGSAKDQIEHRLVRDYIVRRLRDLVFNVRFGDAPAVRELTTVQHLFTEIFCELRPEVTAGTILRTLHPTPAVCGSPTEAARELIAALEPAPRGLYAGAIGFADRDAAEFAVAIRSGLIQDNRATLFAGAGIVAESDAASEYAECAWKMRALREALFPKS